MPDTLFGSFRLALRLSSKKSAVFVPKSRIAKRLDSVRGNLFIFVRSYSLVAYVAILGPGLRAERNSSEAKPSVSHACL
jgi:hypothetical protein